MVTSHSYLGDEVWMRGIAHLHDDLEERGMTAASLGRLSGIDRRVIGRLQSGDQGGSILTHRAIANALGRDPGLFFPRNAVELTRAESLRTLDDRDRTVSQLRAQAQALAEAADTIEGLVAP